MCGSMVDIQPPTAKNRRGKKKKPQDENIMSASVTQGGHKKPQLSYWVAITRENGGTPNATDSDTVRCSRRWCAGLHGSWRGATCTRWRRCDRRSHRPVQCAARRHCTDDRRSGHDQCDVVDTRSSGDTSSTDTFLQPTETNNTSACTATRTSLREV